MVSVAVLHVECIDFVGAVMIPAGAENGIGIISGAFVKDPPTQPGLTDPGMNEWRAFMTNYMPGADNPTTLCRLPTASAKHFEGVAAVQW